MTNPSIRGRLLVVAAALCIAAPAVAAAGDSDGWCDESGPGDRDRHCEIREIVLPARDQLSIDAAPNGGIAVIGEDRADIRILARVAAHRDSPEQSKALADRVVVETEGTIRARGPSGRHSNWWVSYRVLVPRRSNLELRADNGGISIRSVHGSIGFRSHNGGISLDEVSGDVRGRTTNGGVEVTLGGSRWDGDGMDVETTNGGVKLRVPDGYNARLETGTVNGGMHLGFPVTVSGRLDRRLAVDLGSGGPTVRVMTTNGGVRIDQR